MKYKREDKYYRLLHAIEADIGIVRVILHKESLLIMLIHRVLKFLTRRDSFATYTTTIGNRMYVPNDWYSRSDTARYVTLRHERIHMNQFRRWPMAFLDLPVLRLVNTLLFAFTYLMMFPTKITMRARFEREGYEETVRAMIEVGTLNPESIRDVERVAAWLERTFTGSAYLYMARKGYATSFVWAVVNQHLYSEDQRS